MLPCLPGKIEDEAQSGLPEREPSLTINTLPTDVSLMFMFDAVARVHGVKIEQTDGGEWLISR